MPFETDGDMSNAIYVANFGPKGNGRMLEGITSMPVHAQDIREMSTVESWTMDLAISRIKLENPKAVVILGGADKHPGEDRIAEFAASRGIPVLLNGERSTVEQLALKDKGVAVSNHKLSEVGAVTIMAKVADMIRPQPPAKKIE